MKRAIVLSSSAILFGSLAGCTLLHGGWREKEYTDPISNAISTSADKDFALEGVDTEKLNFRISCIHSEGQEPQPENLLITLALKDKSDALTSPEDDYVEYNVPGIGRGMINGTKNNPIRDIQGITFRMSSLVVGASGFAKIVTAAKALDSQGFDVAETAEFAQKMQDLASATGKEGELSAAVSQQVDQPLVAKSMHPITARLSGNFKWGAEKITLRFRSKTGEQVVEVPIDGGSVTKVAETCGWSKNPAPIKGPAPPHLPAAPTPSEAATEAVAMPSDSTVGTVTTEQVEQPLANQANGNFQPSFDCTKASTGSERLICSDPRLAKADADLMADYRTLLRHYPHSSLKQEQRDWLRQVRDRCSDVSCMLRAYQSRKQRMADADMIYSEEEAGI